MSKIKISPIIWIGVLIALFIAIALFFRVYLPYDKVFDGESIKFTSADAYYHMRLVDNLVHNFPYFSSFDPYLIYPGGASVGGINFFNLFLGSIIWLVGLGSPTLHTIDVVGVYFPAVLGALTVIPVYFIGKELFGRWAGVLSAGLIAILPGEFLGRSKLGFTDYHVAEALFTTVTILFLILAIKAASQRQLSFSHLRHLDWVAIRKPLIYSVLAGIFLGIYILTWGGALLFVFIIFVYFIIQFVIDHLRHKSTGYLCFVSVILFAVTLIMYRLVSASPLYMASLIIAIIVPLVVSGVSWLMSSKKIKPVYYPVTLLVLGSAGLGILYLVNPSLINSMFGAFSIFNPTGAQLTTIEMQPLISTIYGNPFSIAWGNFTTGFFLSFVSLGILVYLVIKQGSAEKTLLIVWSLIILIATLGQRRFGYYLAVNVALLTGYLSWRILQLAGFREFTDRVLKTQDKSSRLQETPKKLSHYEILGVNRNATNKEIKRAFQKLALQYHPDSSQSHDAKEKMKEINKAYEVLSNRRRRTEYDRSESTLPQRESRKGRSVASRSSIIINRASMSLVVLVVFFVAFFWNIEPATTVASRVPYAPTDAWISSLSWLKENTPEPFGNPDFYYQLETSSKYRSLSWLKEYVPNPTGDPDFYYQLEQSYPYPESAYGVLAWWDYGYWITRIAHRIPNANPSQDPRALTSIASFFTSQDEETANEIAQELGSTYIILDHETAYIDPTTASGKFWAVVTWAGMEPTEYFELYLLPQENQYVSRPLFYPEYYRSLAVRLYNFNGESVTPESVWVISYQENSDQTGKFYKIITSAEQFSTYEEAEAYILSQESPNYRIVGVNPLISPVSLEPLEHYQLIHSSNSTVMFPDGVSAPAVKIFEYID